MPILETLLYMPWYERAYCNIQFGGFHFRTGHLQQCIDDMEKTYKLIKENHTPSQSGLRNLFISGRAIILPTVKSASHHDGASLFMGLSSMYPIELESTLANGKPQQTFHEITIQDLMSALTMTVKSKRNSISKFTRTKSAATRDPGHESTGDSSTGMRSDWTRSVGSKGVADSDGSASGLDIPYEDLSI